MVRTQSGAGKGAAVHRRCRLGGRCRILRHQKGDGWHLVSAELRVFLSIVFYGSAAVSGAVDDLETLYESQTGRVCRGSQGTESHAGGEGAAGRKGKHGKGG